MIFRVKKILFFILKKIDSMKVDAFDLNFRLNI